MHVPTFPRLTDEEMHDRLAPPAGQVRVIVDSDAHNEIDDQFAIAWALLSQGQLAIEGMVAAPFSFRHHRAPLLAAYHALDREGRRAEDNIPFAGSYHDWAVALRRAGTDPYQLPFPAPDEGMELSYQEIRTVYEHLDEEPAGKVFRGSPGYLPSLDEPYENEGVAHIIERGMADDKRPLYIVAIGAVTNLASALLIEPRLVERIVVVWTSAYPTSSPLSNRPSLNLVQDLAASRLIFDSGVPHVYLPGFYIGAQLRISLPDMERWVKGRGRIGDYLHHLFTHNPIHLQRGITGHFGRTWIIWDLINIAWLLNSRWVPSTLVRAPVLDEELKWQPADGRHLMREATGVDRDAIFRDFLRKLDGAAG